MPEETEIPIPGEDVGTSTGKKKKKKKKNTTVGSTETDSGETTKSQRVVIPEDKPEDTGEVESESQAGPPIEDQPEEDTGPTTSAQPPSTYKPKPVDPEPVVKPEVKPSKPIVPAEVKAARKARAAHDTDEARLYGYLGPDVPQTEARLTTDVFRSEEAQNALTPLISGETIDEQRADYYKRLMADVPQPIQDAFGHKGMGLYRMWDDIAYRAAVESGKIDEKTIGVVPHDSMLPGARHSGFQPLNLFDIVLVPQIMADEQTTDSFIGRIDDVAAKMLDPKDLDESGISKTAQEYVEGLSLPELHALDTKILPTMIYNLAGQHYGYDPAVIEAYQAMTGGELPQDVNGRPISAYKTQSSGGGAFGVQELVPREGSPYADDPEQYKSFLLVHDRLRLLVDLETQEREAKSEELRMGADEAEVERRETEVIGARGGVSIAREVLENRGESPPEIGTIEYERTTSNGRISDYQRLLATPYLSHDRYVPVDSMPGTYKGYDQGVVDTYREEARVVGTFASGGKRPTPAPGRVMPATPQKRVSLPGSERIVSVQPLRQAMPRPESGLSLPAMGGPPPPSPFEPGELWSVKKGFIAKVTPTHTASEGVAYLTRSDDNDPRITYATVDPTIKPHPLDVDRKIRQLRDAGEDENGNTVDDAYINRFMARMNTSPDEIDTYRRLIQAEEEHLARLFSREGGEGGTTRNVRIENLKKEIKDLEAERATLTAEREGLEESPEGYSRGTAINRRLKAIAAEIPKAQADVDRLSETRRMRTVSPASGETISMDIERYPQEADESPLEYMRRLAILRVDLKVRIARNKNVIAALREKQTKLESTKAAPTDEAWIEFIGSLEEVMNERAVQARESEKYLTAARAGSAAVGAGRNRPDDPEGTAIEKFGYIQPPRPYAEYIWAESPDIEEIGYPVYWLDDGNEHTHGDARHPIAIRQGLVFNRRLTLTDKEDKYGPITGYWVTIEEDKLINQLLKVRDEQDAEAQKLQEQIEAVNAKVRELNRVTGMEQEQLRLIGGI